MEAHVLTGLPPAILALILLAIVLSFIELGFQVGKLHPSPSNVSGAIQSITLAMIGILLGFMFSFAEQRYEICRQYGVAESSAISTAYLRASFLKDPATAEEMRRTMVRYRDVRIRFYDAESESVENQALAETAKLGTHLWRLVSTAPVIDPSNARSSLLTGSVNEVLDLSNEQNEAFAEGIPRPIIFLLFTLTAMSGWLLGYGFGRAQHREKIYAITFAFFVAFLTYSISDLSEARHGLIRPSSSALMNVRLNLEGANTTSPP